MSQFDVLNDLQTLLLSKQTLLKFTAGRVIDLISNDVKRMEEETIKFFFLTIFAFFSTAGSMFLITYLISWQAVVGVIFMLFLLPYFAVMSYFSAKLRLRTAAVSDQRISLMNQVVSGIRAIKTHAWEDEYREKIKHTRRWGQMLCQLRRSEAKNLESRWGEGFRGKRLKFWSVD